MKRLIRMKELLDVTGLGRSTIYLYMNQNRFPNAVKIGYRSIAWREDDIQMWLDQCESIRN